ncbi:MAG TPA: ACT domain-containing protein [bacterium]|nr:ACT domain-containing protein [bacterium]
MRAIVTVIGVDRMGIIAGVSQILAELRVNVLDISQTVLQEYFAMIMLADLSQMTCSFAELSAKLNDEGHLLGVSIQVQREEVFKAMHQV